jgi:asparagine synthase (glutamine-hydrolysing)
MCGIAGVLQHEGRFTAPEVLRAMIDPVAHRGPDGVGVHVDGPAGLAHRRLSIIDLAGGGQPMCNEDGTLWITFNGEIFNYVELHKELEAKGHRFATKCDTEVILHAYEEKGAECVHDFNGQWAFAIWDARRGELFLSRDRLGIRPLFHTVFDGTFIFGSEIKSILSFPGVPRRADLKALDQILTFWCCLPPRTFFEGIQELPPGHSMLVSGRQVKVWRYWSPRYPEEFEPVKEKVCAEELLALLIDATRLRLRADVPVGAYLSGGLDSSVTTALIKHFTEAPLKTFSVTFESEEFDESGYQREVIHHLNTEHQSVPCKAAEIGRIFPDVIWHGETPVVRTAPAPMYMLSGLVRQAGYKVVMTGEGSDEILGGYDIFKEAKIRRFWGQQPASKRRPLLLRKLYPYLANMQAQPDAYLKAFFHINDSLDNPLFSHLPRWDLTARIKSMYSDETRATLQGYDSCAEMREQLPREFGRWHPFCQGQYLETVYLLPGYILSSQGDRMAMGHSVEGRYPFLDYRVAEFAAKIPPKLKMKGLNEKYILKRAAGDLVPASVRERPKQPYRAPDAASFFGNGRQPEYVRELLAEESLRGAGIFQPAAVRKLAEKAQRGAAIGIKDNMALVAVLSTQLICEQFMRRFGRIDTHAGN